MTSVTTTNKFHTHPTLLFQINRLICQQLSKSLSNNAKADQRQTKMFHNIAYFFPLDITQVSPVYLTNKLKVRIQLSIHTKFCSHHERGRETARRAPPANLAD